MLVHILPLQEGCLWFCVQVKDIFAGRLLQRKRQLLGLQSLISVLLYYTITILLLYYMNCI